MSHARRRFAPPLLALLLLAPPARPADPAAKPHVFGRVVVLAVGVNDYPKLTNGSNLKYAEDDARQLAALMGEHYAYETTTLLGPKATRAAVLKALGTAADSVGPNDALIVYFSGHGQVVPTAKGGDAGYLIPADAEVDLKDYRDPKRWADQAVDMQQMVEVADRSKARHVLLLVDACCSGFLTKQKGAIDRWDLKTLLFDKSRTVMTATTQRQAAMEDDAAKHGYFTAALLDRLRSPDCASVDDLIGPVRRDVSDRTSGRMRPQFKAFGDGDGMFVFIPKALDADQVKADLDARAIEEVPLTATGLKGVAARTKDRLGRRTTYADFLECVFTHDAVGYPPDPARRAGWTKRFERFREHAAAGDLWATAALHYCHSRGLGTDKDPVAALAAARAALAFEKPAGVGQYLLGRCYELGIGVDTKSPDLNSERARELFFASANAGFAVAQWAASQKLLGGKPSADEAAKLQAWLRKAAGQDFPTAKVLQARLLFTGDAGTPRDPAKVVPLLEEAVQQNCPTAKFALFSMLKSGAPGLPPRDIPRAKKLLLEAADAGHPSALGWLSSEYLQADNERPTLVLDLDKDERQARLLIERAADQGFVPALSQSYKLHAKGVGGPVNLRLARERLDAAAAQDDAWAYFERGNVYFDGGNGVVEQSYEKAFTDFRRAAVKGHPVACVMLAGMYDEGKGFPADRRPGARFHGETHLAMHWFAQALVLESKSDVKLAPQYKDLFDRARKGLQEFRAAVATDADAKDADDRWRKLFPDTHKARP